MCTHVDSCEDCTVVLTQNQSVLLRCTIALLHDSMHYGTTHALDAKANMTNLATQPERLPWVRPAHCVACALRTRHLC